MKRKVSNTLLAMLSILSLSGCGVSQEVYKEVVAEKESIQTKLENTEDSLELIQNNYASLKTKYDSLNGEYNSLIEKFDKLKEETETTSQGTAQANTENTGGSFSFTDGKYIVGIDIPAGTYDLTGTNNHNSLMLYDQDGHWTTISIEDSYQNLELAEGYSFKIRGGYTMLKDNER